MKMVIASAFCLLGSLFLSAWALATPIEGPVIFDLDHAHRFSGFGVSTWIESPHDKQRDSLLRALNARFIRASLPGLVPDDQLPAHVTVADVLAIIRHNDDASTDDAMRRFREELTGLGIRLHVIFWGMPGPWCQNNGTYHRAVTDHLADYANLITGNLLYLKSIGIEPEEVELTNEPNGLWNTQFTPAQYDRLVTLTRAAMDSNGLVGLKIEGPGTSNRPGDFMRELRRTGHVNLLGTYSFHEYDTRTGGEPAGLRVIGPSLDGSPPRTIAITEFSSVDPKFLPAHGGPDPSFNPDFGISVTGEALQLISDGAGEILVWHLEDLPWMTGQTGLLGRDGTRKPVANALVSVFGLIPPGAEAVGPVQNLLEIPLVAFKTADTITICAVNMRKTAVNIVLTIPELPSVPLAESSSFSAQPGAPTPKVTPTKGGFKITIPGRTSFAVRFGTK